MSFLRCTESECDQNEGDFCQLKFCFITNVGQDDKTMFRCSYAAIENGMKKLKTTTERSGRR